MTTACDKELNGKSLPTNTVERDGNRSALFVGAHPDDIEIACGGTLAKLNDLGWITWICVLTDENDAEVAQLRRKETISSAAVCGVEPQHVLFLGASDSSLECNGSTVATLRRLTLEHDCNPDLIFTHSRADSHNDHRVAHDLVLSSFRKKVILCFAVINSLIESHFMPSIFVDISRYNDVKLLALASHHTQQHRIDLVSIAQFSTAFQNQSESSSCEPFEMMVQYGAGAATQVATALCNRVFNTFWSRLAKTQPVVTLSLPVTTRRNHRHQ